LNRFVFFAVWGLMAALAAQQPAPAFEVASIKTNKSGATNSSTSGTGSSFTAINVSLRQLIVFAYRLKDFQVDAPGWTRTARFDITARSPEGATGDNRARMQTLLAERFKLAVHRETREQPVFALVMARSDGRLGPQMKPSAVDCKQATLSPGGRSPCGTNTSVGAAAGKVSAIGQTPESLADTLGNFGLSRMVIDRTGLTGTFDMELAWTPDTARPTDGGGAGDNPSLFTAVQEQLGLKLDAQRGPVEFLIVDRVEQPTPD
jgi:uncharacterized protein (TIGR03435 family)